MAIQMVLDDNDVVVNVIVADDNFVSPQGRIERVPDGAAVRKGTRRVDPDTFEEVGNPSVRYAADGRRKASQPETP